MQTPIQRVLLLVVILGNSLPEKPHEVLIHEVKPEKSRISNPRQHMPRRSNRKKQNHSRNHPEPAPLPPRSARHQKHEHGESHHHKRQQSLRQHRERQARIPSIPAPRRVIFQRSPKAIKRSRNASAQNRFRNQNARKQVISRARRNHHPRIHTRPFAKCPPRPCHR